MPGKTSVRSGSAKETVSELTEGTSSPIAQSGWGAVAKRKASQEASQEASKSIYEFFMTDGETAQIQLLSDEPYCSDFYRVQVGKRWKYFNTQLVKQKYCLLEQSGLKSVWRAAFKVVDYRGKWDKDKKCNEADLGKAYDEVTPQEKLWLVSNTVAMALKSFVDKKKIRLSQVVLEVTRTGNDKSTTYAFEIARDSEDTKLDVLPFKEQFPSAEDCCYPPSDEMLVEYGIVSDVEDTSKSSRRKL